MRKAHRTLLLPILVLSVVGCDMGVSFGDPNEVIVAAPPEWWPEIGDSVFAALGPDVFTLREERAFRLHYVDPTGSEWKFRRNFRNLVLIGSIDHPWMAKALDKLPDSVSVTVPGTYEARDVWARGQTVSMIVVNPAETVASQVYGLVDEVYLRIAERFKEGARYRLYLTGVDTLLADSLREMAGFSLLLPTVYQRGEQDSLYWFRNDQPSPSELIRQFAVTWRTLAPGELSVDSLVSWKETLSRTYYNYPQVVDRESLQTRSRMLEGMGVEEVQGAWQNPPDSNWPAAGPFVLWAVPCPSQDRLYLIDAWLYAPGKDKWEYMLQIETILESFRCGEG